MGDLTNYISDLATKNQRATKNYHFFFSFQLCQQDLTIKNRHLFLLVVLCLLTLLPDHQRIQSAEASFFMPRKFREFIEALSCGCRCRFVKVNSRFFSKKKNHPQFRSFWVLFTDFQLTSWVLFWFFEARADFFRGGPLNQLFQRFAHIFLIFFWRKLKK